MKKSDKNLWSTDYYVLACAYSCEIKTEGILVREAYIMTPKCPPMVARVEMISKRNCSPNEGIINSMLFISISQDYDKNRAADIKVSIRTYMLI